MNKPTCDDNRECGRYRKQCKNDALPSSRRGFFASTEFFIMPQPGSVHGTRQKHSNQPFSNLRSIEYPLKARPAVWFAVGIRFLRSNSQMICVPGRWPARLAREK